MHACVRISRRLIRGGSLSEHRPQSPDPEMGAHAPPSFASAHAVGHPSGQAALQHSPERAHRPRQLATPATGQRALAQACGHPLLPPRAEHGDATSLRHCVHAFGRTQLPGPTPPPGERAPHQHRAAAEGEGASSHPHALACSGQRLPPPGWMVVGGG